MLILDSFVYANNVFPINMPYSNSTSKRALVLSGGGLKGAAFAGVLKALQESNASFDIFGGASAGSIVATLAGAGLSIEEMEDLMDEISKLRRNRLRDLNIRGLFSLFYSSSNYHGLIKGERLEDYFKSKLNSYGIEYFQDLKAPTFIVAVDMINGKEQVFTNMSRGEVNENNHSDKISVSSALRASTSIPGVFIPKEVGNGVYIDGGIRSYLPIQTAHMLGADRILGITFTHNTHTREQIFSSGVVSILSHSIELSLQDQLESDVALLQEKGTKPTLIGLEVPSPSLFDFKEIPMLVKHGYHAMKKLIQDQPHIMEDFLD